MTRRLLVLSNDAVRAKAALWASTSPEKTRVLFQAPKRSIPANDKMWALLTEISEQATHHGQKLEPRQWKTLFMDLFNREAITVPALDGLGWVNVGNATSELSVREFSDLLEIIQAWAASHDISIRNEE